MNEGLYKGKFSFTTSAPGAGKNTQCDYLIEKYKFVHFSAGDLLRAEAKKENEEGKKLREIMNQGKIVPSTITCGLLKKSMDASEGGKNNKFIIDGYPRNLGNIEAWNEVFGDQSYIICVLYLDCPLDICMERLIKRGETSNRTDDQVEVIKKRFITFQEENKTIFENLEKVTKIVKIDSSVLQEKVANNICEELDCLLK